MVFLNRPRCYSCLSWHFGSNSNFNQCCASISPTNFPMLEQRRLDLGHYAHTIAARGPFAQLARLCTHCRSARRLAAKAACVRERRSHISVICFAHPLQGSSAKTGTAQRGLARPLRKDGAHKSRSANSLLLQCAHARGAAAIPATSQQHAEAPSCRCRRDRSNTPHAFERVPPARVCGATLRCSGIAAQSRDAASPVHPSV